MQIRAHTGVSTDGSVATPDGRPTLLAMPDFAPRVSPDGLEIDLLSSRPHTSDMPTANRKDDTMSNSNTSTVTSTDGTTITLDRYGDGPPLVLVGGAFQYRAFDPPTVELAKRLAGDFTVFHYDRRDRGDSGNTPPYTTRREVEDLHAVLEHADERAFVFGNSSGAALALDAAAAGLAIDKLALYEAPFIVDDSRPPVPDDYIQQLNELLSEDRGGDMVELFMTTVIGMPGQMVAGMRQAPMWPGFEAVAHTLIYDGLLMEGTQTGRPIPAERWASVAVPTLVLDGGDSDAWIHHAADSLADMLADAQRNTLEGQTHTVAPEILAPAIREFFQ